MRDGARDHASRALCFFSFLWYDDAEGWGSRCVISSPRYVFFFLFTSSSLTFIYRCDYCQHHHRRHCITKPPQRRQRGTGLKPGFYYFYWSLFYLLITTREVGAHFFTFCTCSYFFWMFHFLLFILMAMFFLVFSCFFCLLLRRFGSIFSSLLTFQKKDVTKKKSTQIQFQSLFKHPMSCLTAFIFRRKSQERIGQ